jgi:hypothetical protein
MGFFGGKKDKVVDFSENYNAARKFAERSSRRSSNATTSDNLDMGFLGSVGESASDSGATTDSFSWDNEPSQPASSGETVGDFSERKQKLAKRLMSMTDKIEDLSNQIYHLTQRVELLEKKNKVNYD